MILYIGIAILVGQVSILSVLAYRGALGVTLWKWTRIPFAVLGSFLLGVGMNGVALPTRNEREEEEETEQVREVQTPAEPGNPDDQFGRFVWSLKGLTPLDIQKQCVAQARGNHFYDPEFDEACETIEQVSPKEPLRQFIQRRKLERVA